MTLTLSAMSGKKKTVLAFPVAELHSTGSPPELREEETPSRTWLKPTSRQVSQGKEGKGQGAV